MTIRVGVIGCVAAWVAAGVLGCAPATPATPATTVPASGPARAEAAAPEHATAGPSPAAAPAMRPPGAGTAPPAPPSAEDTIRVGAIEKAINDTHVGRHECWARAAADNMALSGDIDVRIEFTTATQYRASVIEDKVGDPVLRRCLVELYQGYAWPPVFQADSVIEIPFSFEAPRFQYTVARAHVPARELTPGITTQVLLSRQNTGNEALTLRHMRLQPGAALAIDGYRQATRAIYVLAGEGGYSGRDPGRGGPIVAGQALYIPAQVPFGLRAGSQALEVLLFGFPSQALEPSADDRVTGAALATLGRADELPRLRAVPDVYEVSGPEGTDGGVLRRVAIYFDAETAGDQAAYLGVLTAAPGMKVPSHRHANETEAGFLLDGAATMTVDGETMTLSAGTAMQIPPGLEHSAVVTGTAALRMVQVYTPSGPEQLFKRPPSGTGRIEAKQ